jgi:hypothetical protein
VLTTLLCLAAMVLLGSVTATGCESWRSGVG